MKQVAGSATNDTWTATPRVGPNSPDFPSRSGKCAASHPQGKITSRTSSITNSFVDAIIPIVIPSAKEVEAALRVLGMTPETACCSYCGDTKIEWDHLRPLVLNKQPTGHISEIANLVPSCGKCNQSKGNKPWRSWITSTARLSPHTRGVTKLDLRIERLEAFEATFEPTVVDFGSVADEDLWSEHWESCAEIHKLMHEAQANAEAIRLKIVASLVLQTD